MKGVVCAQDGAKVLAIFGSKVVVGQPQLTKIFVELHRSHWRRGGGGGGAREMGSQEEGDVGRQWLSTH